MPAAVTTQPVTDNWVLLPIASRELAVATRKSVSFWIRMFAALAAVIIGAGFLILQWLFGMPPAGMGRALFHVLTAIGFGAALLAGVFLTADSISEEKREGTLGFLFLTDLRGYDVVTGKLVATSLRTFYSIVAVFPVLGIAMLLGGVSGAQFWRTCLALLLALLGSLTFGLFVSSLNVSAARALGRTVALLVVWIAVPPIAQEVLSRFSPGRYSWAGLFSPFILFTSADNGARFWNSFAGNAAVCALLFAATCYFTPRMWQDRGQKQPRSPGRARKSHPELMDPNPTMWLSSRDAWLTRKVVLGLSLLLFTAVVCTVLIDGTAYLLGWGTVFGMLTFFLYLWTASRYSRLFVQLRQNGFLELLLATPLTPREIVDGHWNGWVRMFGLPLAILVAAHIFGSGIASYSGFGAFPGQQGAASSILLASSALSAVLGAALFLGNLAALAWFGAYAGLTSKSPAVALLKTFGFVQILPWFVIAFLSGLVTVAVMMPIAIRTPGATNPALIGPMMPLLMSCAPAVLGLIKDVVFIIWARKRLLTQFRHLATKTPGQAFYTPVPPVAAHVAGGTTPPIIPATQ